MAQKIGQIAYALARQLLVKDKGGIASLPNPKEILTKVQDIFDMLKAGGYNPVSAEKAINSTDDLKRVLTDVEMKLTIDKNLRSSQSEGIEEVMKKMDRGIPLNPSDQAKMEGIETVADDKVLDAFRGFKPVVIQGGKSKGIDAMKEANSLIGRKGKYKNISESDAKTKLDELQEIINEANAEPDLGTKLKNFDGDPDAMAQGGRIGFSGGGAGFAGDPMEGDQYTMGQQIPGSPQVSMGEFGPVNVGIFGGGGYSKNEIVPGVNQATTNQNYGIAGQLPIGDTGFTIGGDYMKSRANDRFTGDAIPGQTFKSVPTDSDRFNVGINFRKPLSGGRFGFKEGGPPNPGRRSFMKLMAGLASLPVVGKLFKGAKVADKIVQLKNTTTTMPAWFPDLVDKFINKGVGNKIDADLMEYTVKELPDVKLLKQDNGAIRVEGKNAYNEEYYIDYEPPGVELIDEATGKAVKTKGDFVATDTEYRMVSPEDYDIDGVNVDKIDDILGGSSNQLEGFAKGTGKTKYTTGQRRIDEADARGASTDESLRADVNDPYADVDGSDFVDPPEDFATGGLAYMLGE